MLASNSKIQSSLLLPCYLALSIFCLSSASILSESLLCSSTLCLTFPSASLNQAALNLVLSHYMCILPLSIHLCLSHCINELQRSHDKWEANKSEHVKQQFYFHTSWHQLTENCVPIQDNPALHFCLLHSEKQQEHLKKNITKQKRKKVQILLQTEAASVFSSAKIRKFLSSNVSFKRTLL